MGWKDNKFPDADDPKEVGWLISYWRKMPCTSGCHPDHDYQLESRQFAHIVKAATPAEARKKFLGYVANRREAGEKLNMKGLTLFLSEVVAMELILDDEGKLI